MNALKVLNVRMNYTILYKVQLNAPSKLLKHEKKSNINIAYSVIGPPLVALSIADCGASCWPSVKVEDNLWTPSAVYSAALVAASVADFHPVAATDEICSVA